MRSLPVIAIGLLLFAPARAEDKNERLLRHLRERQKDAHAQLTKRIEQMETLIADLAERGQKDKADRLRQVLDIIRQRQITLDDRKGAGDRQLADLQTAMQQMTQILQERPDDTNTVQDLAQKVVQVLDQIVSTLLNKDDLRSLEERGAQLKDIRDRTRELTRRQGDLKRETQRAVPRTAAEKTAKEAAEQIRKLQKELDDLDREAREQLSELEQAREWAAGLDEMLQRQRRIQDETGVRAGKTEDLTPKINSAIAKLEQVSTAARRAAEEAEERAAIEELARELTGLRDRQKALAKEIAARAALERAATALKEKRGVNRELLEDAAKAAPKALAETLRAAAERPDDKAALDAALAAAQEALAKTPDEKTLARDQKVAARDIEQALMKTPAKATDAAQALNAAGKQARKAAAQLERNVDATQAAADAARELEKAAEALAKRAQDQKNEEAAAARKQQREAAARSAAELAKQLKQLADGKDAQNAGLRGLIEDARRAAEKAAAEMQAATEAGAKGDARRAQDDAKAAQERTERATEALRAGMEERHDLTRRQGKVAKDLAALATNNKDRKESAGALQQAAKAAEQAQESLRKDDFAKAGEQQKQVLDQLQQLKRQADDAVRKAAADRGQALQQAQDKTAKAADKAGAVSRDLKQAQAGARENDARRRLEEAAERTAKAEEALRRSLRRLKDAMPKSAEQDRREAQDQLTAAQRNLDGVRESHRADPNAQQQMKDIAKRQKQLEDDVRMLEENLKRMKEKSGAQRMQDAQSAMRQAKQHLEQGEPDEAEQAQDRAEKSLKEAQKELDNEERRYRNLRQYELLFKLKEELKNFRRTAQAHRETLGKIDAQVRTAGRVTRFINKSELKPLAQGVKQLERDVSEKSAAIEKERAIVYTYILKGCAGDLREVEAQLSLKEVGLVPQEMLGDVVRRFDMAIAGLDRNLQERQEQQKKDAEQDPKKKKEQQSQASGKPMLVPPDAEVRMVMVLQKALNQEREDFFGSRPDFGKRQPTPSERSRLERLYHRQGSLAELFDSLRQSLLGQEQEDPMEVPDENPEGGGDGR